MEPLKDEKEYRRPTWTAGVNVVLGDGRAWSLPRPVVVFVPADTDIGFEIRAKLDDDGTFGGLLKALDDAEEADRVIGASLRVARALLLTNYDLSAEQVAELIQFNYADEGSEGYRIREEVMAVAWGRGPSLPKADSATT